MSITFEAVYEGGVLKPSSPLPLKEHQVVRVTVEPKTSWVEETYGLVGWTGSPELAEQIGLDGDLDYPEPPPAP